MSGQSVRRDLNLNARAYEPLHAVIVGAQPMRSLAKCQNRHIAGGNWIEQSTPELWRQHMACQLVENMFGISHRQQFSTPKSLHQIGCNVGISSSDQPEINVSTIEFGLAFRDGLADQQTLILVDPL